MKKITAAILICAILLIAITGCSTTTETNDLDTNQNTTAITTSSETSFDFEISQTNEFELIHSTADTKIRASFQLTSDTIQAGYSPSVNGVVIIDAQQYQIAQIKIGTKENRQIEEGKIERVNDFLVFSEYDWNGFKIFENNTEKPTYIFETTHTGDTGEYTLTIQGHNTNDLEKIAGAIEILLWQDTTDIIK